MEQNKSVPRDLAVLREQHKVAEIEKLKCLIAALKQDVDTWSTKASKMKRSYLDLKEKAENEVTNLREENCDLKDAIKDNDDTMKELKQDFLKMEKVLQKEKAGTARFLDKNLVLQGKIEEQARVLEILHADNSKLSKLYHDLAEKNMVFQNNKKEIAYLKRAVRELLEQVRIKTETITVLRGNIKDLQSNSRADNQKPQSELKAAGGKVDAAKAKVFQGEKAGKEGNGEAAAAAAPQMPTTARNAKKDDDVKRLKVQKVQEPHKPGSMRKTN